jgi:preprotein translocase subunit SecA
MRIFAGDWVKKVLTALGMKEGECIESPMVSRQIAKAQKRVEERNFDIRKNLLEYDEVMDLQRRRVYGYRQELLEGANGRLRILQMMRQQIEKAVARYLDENYPAESFAAYASSRFGVELEADDFRRCTFDEAQRIARDRAQSLAVSLLQDQIEECFNPAEDRADWKWEAFRKFLLSRWNIQWSIRKLQETDRDELVEKLLPEITAYIEKLDLQEGAAFFDPDYGLSRRKNWWSCSTSGAWKCTAGAMWSFRCKSVWLVFSPNDPFWVYLSMTGPVCWPGPGNALPRRQSYSTSTILSICRVPS